MYEVLPYPNIKGQNLDDLKIEVNDYLIQLRETLEFILGDIGLDNLSQEVLAKLDETQPSTSSAIIEDEFQQVASKTLSVSDVVNSALFKSAVKSEIARIEFSINFDTGNLEYTVKE